jgi:hypothetical protein
MVTLPEPAQPVDAPAAVTQRPRRTARGRPIVAPPPTAEVVLASRAAEVVREIAAGPPERWLLPGFARDVDLVRRQLGPLRDRRMLADSYERESTRLVALQRLARDPALPPLPVGPLEAAYAVRWLELAEEGTPLPPWAAWLGETTDSNA